ncbi:MAG: carbohydrate ABC transporter permease [Defluviitaleaceae bacterium]|nr:carbohydrate ABC transporter permease [Defluviitaleaceae bacterium]
MMKRIGLKGIFKKNKSGRSFMGNLGLFLVLSTMAFVFLFPIIFMLNRAFMPLSELLRFPPLIFVRNPTFDHFFSVSAFFNTTLVPFWRYVFNTVLIVAVGVFGQILFASMAAFPLAKYDFAGDGIISKMIVVALMVSPAVTAVPSYLIMSYLGLIDTYFAIILPTFGTTLGLYLMKNFMSVVPSSLIEAAHIDGANEVRCLFKVVMPAVKPAFITLFILSFQVMWGATGGQVIYTEQLKPLSAALNQIAATASIARAGDMMVVSLIMFIIPIGLFIFMQSQVLETMTTSGMKE